jgi:hypothetical protein
MAAVCIRGNECWFGGERGKVLREGLGVFRSVMADPLHFLASTIRNIMVDAPMLLCLLWLFRQERYGPDPLLFWLPSRTSV